MRMVLVTNATPIPPYVTYDLCSPCRNLVETGPAKMAAAMPAMNTRKSRIRKKIRIFRFMGFSFREGFGTGVSVRSRRYGSLLGCLRHGEIGAAAVQGDRVAR